MAATPPMLTDTEQAERSIIATLHSLSTAERATDRLTPEEAFDVACALAAARDALDQALAALPQLQARQRAA